MKKLTLEQQTVVESAGTQNITVNSVAGCGKTTVSLSIADRYPERKILLLTYNRTLADETKARATQSNLTIYTFHGLCYHFYGKTINDRDMAAVIIANSKPTTPPTSYDIIILDETQDMTDLYFRFMLKFLRDLSHQPTFVILGDARQSIYGYKGSDSRYLTLASQCFRTKTPCTALTIRESFRITSQMASFINTHLFGYNYILSKKITPAQSVFYHIVDPFKFSKFVLDHIKKSNYAPGDVFILTNSTKTKAQSPVKVVENYLADNNYKCYVQGDDEEHVDPSKLINRVHISSYHRAKGRERKIVFVYGFDRSTYNIQCRLPFRSNEEPDKSTLLHHQSVNVFYVALSRATEELHLIRDKSKPAYPTVNSRYLAPRYTPDIINEKQRSTASDPPSVTTVLRHLSDQAIDQLSAFFTVTSTVLSQRTTTDTKLAPALIGSAITIYSDFKLHNKIPDYINRFIQAPPGVNYSRELLKVLADEYLAERSSSTLFELASYLDFCEYGYKSNYMALCGNYHKIDIMPVVQSYDIVMAIVSPAPQLNFEASVKIACVVGGYNYIMGRVDCMTADTIYEIKHKQTTTLSDIIQLALYGCDVEHEDKNLVLINTKEGRLYTITNFTKRSEFTTLLSQLKQTSVQDSTDQEFLNTINDIYDGKPLTYKAPCLNNAKTKKSQSNIDLLSRLQTKNASKSCLAVNPHVSISPIISQSLRAGTASNTSNTPLPITRNLQNG